MVNFIFCIHIHQPVGNFDYVIKDAFKRCYLPLLRRLKEYPELKFCLHISGVLLEWIKKNEDEYLEILNLMIETGQVELMAAGYYEPILAIIPERDRIDQIRLMKDELNSLLGVTPEGLWVTERVWEPHLPKTLYIAGIKYVVVDDYHFIKAGLRQEEIMGYYLTEEEGCVIRVFSGSEKLRYLIPFQPIEEFDRYLKNISATSLLPPAHDSQLIVFADDGEKFGIWPGTYDYVYKEGWLDGFLGYLKDNIHWLRTTTFSEYLNDHEALGRVYLPTASYREMEEWTLPPEASTAFSSLYKEVSGWGGEKGEGILRFMKGGFWRNFLAKYPESDWMHKRMLNLNHRVDEIESRVESQGSRKRKENLLSTLHTLLYKSQCNDAYWHGVFGGLYLPHLRSAVYENLIKAERLIESFKFQVSDFKSQDSSANKDLGLATWNLHLEEVDLDCDTHKEIRLTTPYFDIFISPKQGGFVRELDYRPKAYNLANILSRHQEGYHNKVRSQESEGGNNKTRSIHDHVLTKEEGLERFLVYDNYTRGMFHDRFLKETITPEDVMRGNFEEVGDFLEGEYFPKVKGQESRVEDSGSLPAIHLFREGWAFGKPVRVDKLLYVDGDEPQIMVKYTITNLGDREINGIFGSEVNLLLGFGLERRPIDWGAISEYIVGEDWLGLELKFSFSPAPRLFTYPVETVSLSEGGVERIFQGLCLLPLYEILLKPYGAFSLKCGIDIRDV